MAYEPYDDELTQLSEIITNTIIELDDYYELRDIYDTDEEAYNDILRTTETNLRDNPQEVIKSLEYVKLDSMDEPHEKTTYVENLIERVQQEYMPDNDTPTKDITPIPTSTNPTTNEQPQYNI